MRLDHLAYRVADRNKTAQFICEAFGYFTQQEFEIKFDDGSSAKCLALSPPEKSDTYYPLSVWHQPLAYSGWLKYHMAPEIFVSDGTPYSIVGRWVNERGGIGGVHHLAYEVDDVKLTMDNWLNNKLATFSSKEPIECEDLVQVFTNPHPLTGIIYEFIHRRGYNGFCRDSVKQLMISSYNK